MFLISKANASSTSSFTISPSYEIPIEALWEVVMEGFSGVWPASRTRVGGVSVGE